MKFAQKALSMALALVLFLAGTAQAAGPFVDNGDGTGTDESTNITWLKTDVKAGTYNDCCTYCQRLVCGGYDDWRLPTANEIVTITYYTAYDERDPMVDAAFAIERGRSHYNARTSSNSNASGYRVRPSFIDGLGLMIIVTRTF